MYSHVLAVPWHCRAMVCSSASMCFFAHHGDLSSSSSHGLWTYGCSPVGVLVASCYTTFPSTGCVEGQCVYYVLFVLPQVLAFCVCVVLSERASHVVVFLLCVVLTERASHVVILLLFLVNVLHM